MTIYFCQKKNLLAKLIAKYQETQNNGQFLFLTYDFLLLLGDHTGLPAGAVTALSNATASGQPNRSTGHIPTSGTREQK